MGNGKRDRVGNGKEVGQAIEDGIEGAKVNRFGLAMENGVGRGRLRSVETLGRVLENRFGRGRRASVNRLGRVLENMFGLEKQKNTFLRGTVKPINSKFSLFEV